MLLEDGTVVKVAALDYNSLYKVKPDFIATGELPIDTSERGHLAKLGEHFCERWLTTERT